MDVIDLCNDNQVPTEQRFATNIPREVRKTVNHLLHTVGEIRTFMNRDDLTRFVLNYCKKNPNIKDIEILSMNIQTELLLNNIDSDPKPIYKAFNEYYETFMTKLPFVEDIQSFSFNPNEFIQVNN